MTSKGTVKIQTAPNDLGMGPSSIVRIPRYVVYKDLFRRPDIERVLSSSPPAVAAAAEFIGENRPSIAPKSAKFRNFSTSFNNNQQQQQPSSDFARVSVKPLTSCVSTSSSSNYTNEDDGLSRSNINRMVRAAHNNARRHEFFTKQSSVSSPTAKSAAAAYTTTITLPKYSNCWSSCETSPPSAAVTTIRNNFIDYSTYKNELASNRTRSGSTSNNNNTRYIYTYKSTLII